jgi:hypothetical protein
MCTIGPYTRVMYDRKNFNVFRKFRNFHTGGLPVWRGSAVSQSLWQWRQINSLASVSFLRLGLKSDRFPQSAVPAFPMQYRHHQSAFWSPLTPPFELRSSCTAVCRRCGGRAGGGRVKATFWNSRVVLVVIKSQNVVAMCSVFAFTAEIRSLAVVLRVHCRSILW